MDKREFVKQVYETVWGSNARPRQFIIDGIKKETYTYDETIEKSEAMQLVFKDNEYVKQA